jgi:hypothetical protein
VEFVQERKRFMKSKLAGAGKYYRNLKKGERLQVGDEVYTWTDPDCTKVGWVKITQQDVDYENGNYVIDEGHVPARRPIK